MSERCTVTVLNSTLSGCGVTHLPLWQCCRSSLMETVLQIRGNPHSGHTPSSKASMFAYISYIWHTNWHIVLELSVECPSYNVKLSRASWTKKGNWKKCYFFPFIKIKVVPFIDLFFWPVWQKHFRHCCFSRLVCLGSEATQLFCWAQWPPEKVWHMQKLSEKFWVFCMYKWKQLPFSFR